MFHFILEYLGIQISSYNIDIVTNSLFLFTHTWWKKILSHMISCQPAQLFGDVSCYGWFYHTGVSYCRYSVANMAKDREAWKIVRVMLLCAAWYLISSGNNVVGKTLLNEFPYPMTVTMVQLVSIAMCSSPVLRWMKVRRRSDISWSYYKRIIIPLALGKFLASVFSHVSIWRVPVSYAHTGMYLILSLVFR